MPKLKTKSAVKKRFSVTASGKLKITQARNNHFRRNRSKDQIRNLRGMTIMRNQQEVKNVLKYFLPYG